PSWTPKPDENWTPKDRGCLVDGAPFRVAQLLEICAKVTEDVLKASDWSGHTSGLRLCSCRGMDHNPGMPVGLDRLRAMGRDHAREHRGRISDLRVRRRRRVRCGSP